jgi:hypothetical protein
VTSEGNLHIFQVFHLFILSGFISKFVEYLFWTSSTFTSLLIQNSTLHYGVKNCATLEIAAELNEKNWVPQIFQDLDITSKFRH